MKNMRRGFTMIELIFVIVIIGILASVAIPKLAATRDDAKISSIVANTRTIIEDMQAFYIAKGANVWNNSATIADVTNVPVNDWASDCGPTDTTDLVASSDLALCDEATVCVNVWQETEGFLTPYRVMYVWAQSGSAICDAVAADPAIVALVGVGEDGIRLGGASVAR